MSNFQITYKKDNDLIHCYFQSKTGDRKKLIGTINLTDRTLYKKISPQKHTFNVSDSIGISYELLKIKDFDLIQIQCGYDCYETSRQYFMEHSDFKRFGGYELQKLMKRELFGMDKAESWEYEQKLKIQKLSENPTTKKIQLEMFQN